MWWAFDVFWGRFDWWLIELLDSSKMYVLWYEVWFDGKMDGWEEIEVGWGDGCWRRGWKWWESDVNMGLLKMCCVVKATILNERIRIGSFL